jgi:MFS family permease
LQIPVNEAPIPDMKGNRQPGGIAVAFGNRAFRTYTLGSIPSTVGTWIQRLGVMWLAWTMTGSATWLGAIGFADMFPVVVVGPLAGAFADRLDRLAAARVLQFLQMGQSLALVTLTATGWITIESLLVLTVLSGILTASFQPFRQSIIANMVAGAELPAVIAVNSAVWHGSRFVGPAIAGVVIASWGVVPAFAINAVSYPIFIYALFRIQMTPRPVARRSISEVPREILDGLRYAVSHRVIAPVLVIILASSFLGRPVMELLPGFASEVFGRGAAGLAWLTSAAGLGAMVVGIWFAQWGRAAWLTNLLVMGVAVLGVSLAIFAVTENFWFAVVVLAVVGGASTLGGITTQTVVQSVVVDQMRGRVLSIYGMIWMGVPGVGALLAGILSDAIGLHLPILGAGGLCLLAWLWALTRREVIGSAQHEKGRSDDDTQGTGSGHRKTGSH